jgi:hypothetical protein
MAWTESDHRSKGLRRSRPAARCVFLLKALLLVASVAMAGALAGCSLIGFGVGAAFDARHEEPVSLSGWQVDRVGIGKRVSVVLRDSHVIKGVFGGLDASPHEYKTRYTAWRAAQTTVDVPTLGDSITIETTAGKEESGEFQGFEYSSLSLQRKGHPTASQVPYKKIARASNQQGATWDGAQLAGMAAAGLLPLRSCMLVDKTRVPLEQVLQVAVKRARHGKTIGFLVGAMIDAIVVVAIADSFGSSSHEQPVYTSCPYVYSFQGERYVREGDVFPGAIFKAAQRPDRLALEHLVASTGSYRLRLVNELQEIEYLDEVKLLLVDGPEGMPVVAAPGGRFRTLTGPMPPIKATDLGGRAVLEQVSGQGDGAWAGNPFARDPEHPSRSREGLLLEFARPLGAKAVTIVCRAQPTPWASRLMREVLALQGPNLSAWYARVEADPAARAEFQGAYRREAQLILSVWTGAVWREAGTVNPHEATELPLDGIRGDVLRIRIDSTAGLWSIDSVQVDYGGGAPVEVIEAGARVARTQRDGDVRALLEHTDGRRHRLEPNRDSVNLVFDAPPLKPGRRRSLFLKASGYYTILVPTRREEDPTLFAKLLKEPGRLGQFGLDLAQSELDERLSEESKHVEGGRPGGR